MWRMTEDAKILAKQHRTVCQRRECPSGCPEASPLYWAKALKTQVMPPEAKHDVPKASSVGQRLNRTVEQAAAVLEEQRRLIDDAQEVLEAYDGSVEDLPEFLAAMKTVLERRVGDK